MLADLPLRLQQLIWLILLTLLVPTFMLARRSVAGLGAKKAYGTFAIRAVVIGLLTLVLTDPTWVKRGEGLTVTVLLDRSQSVPYALRTESVEFLRRAADARLRPEREDRVAVVSVARDAAIAAMPDSLTVVDVYQDVADATATNLAAGVKTAMAIMPDDTANRIVLASDGNETVDSVLEAADLARANGVPIDVVLLEYEHDTEVLFDRIVAPARARRGQSARIKLVLRSRGESSGTLRLFMDDVELDLSESDVPGRGLPVELSPGPNVFPLTVSMDRAGRSRFVGIFEPDGQDDDFIPDNNQAEAVSFVSGEGRVLVVDANEMETAPLVGALLEAEIDVERLPPTAITDLSLLSGFDAVLLCNVARYQFTDEQDRILHAYVHDLGGGLAMIGGPLAFGAGQWNDSQVADALPVRMDPPQTRKMPRGALALVMHSCEMPQGNYWGKVVAQAAIKAISRLDYVGILEYNWNPGAVGIGGVTWAFELQEAGDKTAAIEATEKLTIGDMPDFGASMQLALNGLSGVRAGQKHVIIISDGDPSPPTSGLLDQYKQARITVTTVMVGGHGTPIDKARMEQIAETTGGESYFVQNPKQLPQIFIKEAQLVSRSLIQEGRFQPQVRTAFGSPIEGFGDVPAIDGYILTAPREGLALTPIQITTEEGRDPLFAAWNYGLGRSFAYTSDVTGRWGGSWAGWSQFQDFWEQTVRWVMRPASPRNIEVTTSREGDQAVVQVDALDEDAGFLDFLTLEARLVEPDGTSRSISLPQTGPGRYRMTFPVPQAGAYLVNITPTMPDGETGGHVQAAVNVPYADEFRATSHNAALLEELARRTGGRVIDVSSPEAADLFARADLEVPASPKAIWDLLIVIAASLLLLDIAGRRLAIDTTALRAALRRATGRTKGVSEGTVAAWKKVATKREDAGRASTKFEASDADEAGAIDVSAGPGVASGGGPSAPGPAAARRTAVDPSADEQDEDSHTSRLLKAKRRARGGDDERSNEERPST